jgi:mono/diheme cytochrome c family protein/uncharacterized membrane protein
MVLYNLNTMLFWGLNILILLNSGGGNFPTRNPMHAQDSPSGKLDRNSVRGSSPAESATPAVSELFRQNCAKCHTENGTGNRTSGRVKGIPDFTKSTWQVRRTDEQLAESILDGKGSEMPPHRGEISEEQVRGLVAYVRAFAQTDRKPRQETQKGPALAEFDKRFHRLQDEQDKLKRQFHEHTDAARKGVSSSRAKPRRHEAVQQSSQGVSSSPTAPRQHEAVQQTSPAASGASASRELFLEHCAECHGAKGTGNAVRRRLPEIPDFTDPSWQARRTDAQLMASIIDGKGPEMPPMGEEISKEQARGLVVFVRSFGRARPEPKQGNLEGPASAPTTEKPEQVEQEEPAPVEPETADPPKPFLEKLTHWLGKFHPPSVHFPIALITAAAVAELLRMATRNPAFDAISRFCICLGALTAVTAGILGWFLGGFRLYDASWVMMTHRWLGTSTVACSGLLLVLSELSRSRDRRKTRICFRATLVLAVMLVSVTGFLGGAVVFGLNHYKWPQ